VTTAMQLPLYKLTDLLYREARITDVTIKMFCPTRSSKDSRANAVHITCAAQTVGSMDEYRAGTRSVDGLLRACFRVYLSV